MRNLSMGKKYTPSGSASANSRIREKVEEKRENPGLMFRRPPSETPVQCCDVGKKGGKKDNDTSVRGASFSWQRVGFVFLGGYDFVVKS
jgi:hypothetical protein